MKLRAALRAPAATLKYIFWRNIQKRRLSHLFSTSQTHPTYALASEASLADPLFKIDLLQGQEAHKWLALAGQYCGHKFNVLGSGWTEVKHGIEAKGLGDIRFPHAKKAQAGRSGEWLTGRINDPNLAEARRVWSLVSEKYEPLDWQLDFKSGFRWSERSFLTEVPITPARGADIKVPWELSRSHHLTHLALAYGTKPEQIFPQEFRDQILDFTAQNPPHFGVNWTCAMDIAIRAVNWIAAYDLFVSQGTKFDYGFEQIFARSILEHGRSIWQSLEWHPFIRSNHYLANICGLIFIAKRLHTTAETAKWLRFAEKEFRNECLRQFLADGANFESSTSYHRLSAEMVAYTAAVLHKDLDPGFFAKLEKMAEFSMHVTKHSGRVAQIGDNDSGRFLKLEPFDPEGESFLDHRPLVSLINGYFGREDFGRFAGMPSLGSLWIEARLEGRRLPSYRQQKNFQAAESRTIRASDLTGLKAQFDRTPKEFRNEITFPWPARGAGAHTEHFSYPNFGAYIFRAEHISVVIRCGSKRWDVSGGHAHNDQLNLDLQVDGDDILKDPGTFLYTPLPEERNLYRSTHSHFAPTLEGTEQSPLNNGLFILEDKTGSLCLHFNSNEFIGRCTIQGQQIYRHIHLTPDALIVRDWTEGPRRLAKLPTESPPFSAGYGQRDIT